MELTPAEHIFTIITNCLEMLNRRGYSLPKKRWLRSSIALEEKMGEDVIRRRGTDLTLGATEPSGRRVLVMWPQIDPDLSMRNPTDIGCKDIGEVLKKARYKLKAFAKDGLTIELFEEVELLVDCVDHYLVPLHIPLTEPQKIRILEMYNVQETQVPRISVDDPIVRHFGLEAGSMFKIIRETPNAGRYVTYRLVS